MYVYKKRGKRYKEQDVLVGPSSVTMVQVLEGLDEGDRIYLAAPEKEVE